MSPGPSRVSPLILDQHRLALDHHQQFVLAFVPMALGRPGAGLQPDMARAEIAEAERRREAAIPAAGDRPSKGGG